MLPVTFGTKVVAVVGGARPPGLAVAGVGGLRAKGFVPVGVGINGPGDCKGVPYPEVALVGLANGFVLERGAPFVKGVAGGLARLGSIDWRKGLVDSGADWAEPGCCWLPNMSDGCA